MPKDYGPVIGYAIAALVLLVVLYYTWQFILGGLALVGAWAIYQHLRRRSG